MTKKVNLTDINYIQYGNDKGKDIVLLHGWGQNIEMMKPLGDLLADNYHITIIDLPGFGKSKEPATILDVGDYTEIVHDLLESLFTQRKTILSFYQNRMDLFEDAELKSLIRSTNYCIVDSKHKIRPLERYAGKTLPIVDITPFDTRADFGISQQLTVQNLSLIHI